MGKLQNDMSKEEWNALVEAMKNPEIIGSDIAKALRDSGYNIMDSTLGRHRRRQNGNGCQCEPD